MKALYYEQFGGPITHESLPDPTPLPGSVIIKVGATGLCRSDWHGWMGHDPDINLPHVPGHELAGTIVETGREVKNFRVGERVTVPFVAGCGRCGECISGNHQVCDHQSQPGFTHWGSFAEFVRVDYADVNLVRLPKEIDDLTAATLGCRFVTSFRAIVDQGKVRGGQCVAIHGCGGIGLSAIMIARALGAQVIAVDIDEGTLDLARRLGAKHTVNAKKVPDVVEAIRDLSGGGVHVSMDALGSQTTCFNSIANLRKRGKHLQVGLMTGDHQHPTIPMDRVLAHELEILGCHGMQAFRYADMLNMIRSGKLKPGKLVKLTVTLKEAAKILTKMNDFDHRGVMVIDSFG
ncbi:zinc-dependent alcohol dehydrogenase family protein [Lewinella sp. W8]|uniref:zinc-dependent alcohol dehydrogenase family protein n=1 Tax=Lewinella sp. W8 TaxID=2528208 RepID=UPI0010684B0F|nr:zinc-dependent alcohol dehydrogenase family protein [Lewinella sp. W8]MTB50201.1 alcohol dehydrogenase catalytic domain-containing protein [Lewinella sp. W8]